MYGLAKISAKLHIFGLFQYQTVLNNYIHTYLCSYSKVAYVEFECFEIDRYLVNILSHSFYSYKAYFI